jgi:hypothetical protein
MHVLDRTDSRTTFRGAWAYHRYYIGAALFALFHHDDMVGVLLHMPRSRAWWRFRNSFERRSCRVIFSAFLPFYRSRTPLKKVMCPPYRGRFRRRRDTHAKGFQPFYLALQVAAVDRRDPEDLNRVGGRRAAQFARPSHAPSYHLVV